MWAWIFTMDMRFRWEKYSGHLPMTLEGTSGSGMCTTTGCMTDLNSICPSELQVGNGEGCKSACEAFGSPEYCCSGAFSTPESCKPSAYSQMFKAACPSSYSYAYDDPTCTFTCSGADYTLTFCQSSPSQKSTKDTTTPTNATPSSTNTDTATTANGDAYFRGSGVTGAGSGSGSSSFTDSGSGSDTGTVSGSGSGALLADGSYLAGLALGKSSRPTLSSMAFLFCALFSSSILSNSFMDFL